MGPIATQNIVSRVSQIASTFQIASLGPQISACEALLAQEAYVDVVVVGQFKSGKSTFLNSLIGEPILPVGVIPVTTAVARLQYGEQPAASVLHRDGTKVDIAVAEIDRYTSEAENPSNQKGVAAVDVFLPSLHRYGGLRLIDTPGLGSIFQAHRDISKGLLPEIGAALLAVSVGRPLSEGDLALLKELEQHTPRIALLLTKTDLIDNDQQAQVVDFFHKTLRRECGKEFPIFFFSDRQQTAQHRERLDRELLLPMSKDRTSTRDHILRHKTRHLLDACLDYLRIALKASEDVARDRAALRARVLDEKLSADLVRQEMTAVTRDHASKTRTNITRHLDPSRSTLEHTLLEHLNRDLPSWSGNLWKLSRRFEAWLEEQMTVEIQRLSEHEHPHFLESLDRARASLERELRTFRTLLENNVQQVLGIRLTKAEWQIPVSEPKHPDIRVGNVFDIQIDLLWFLIPMAIFRDVFERRFRREIPWAVEVNFSRLASQWEARINEAIEGMKKQAISYVEQELATIDSMLSTTSDQAAVIRATIEELQQLVHIFKERETS